MSHPNYSNRLASETSPYLLQHAHNPVEWYPWGKEALEKAELENKPLLISIGYSACHWCHVMERECFEDSEVAKLMNRFFICIKVDREERPDLDQIYMNAVQLMAGQGGWPLNCFALPDGRPFYGGTYFPKAAWMNVLEKIHEAFTENVEKVEEYAGKLTEGIRLSELILPVAEKLPFTADVLDKTVEKWSRHFDFAEGGPNRAPKFPMPGNLQFLLHYAVLHQRKSILDYVLLTLNKMAYGGIYDHINGGFARYATDVRWKIPHFEKMLYDNAQMVSLYAEAYQLTNDPLYRQVVYETIEFIRQEMTSPEGAFYSALDADSDGEEGKYYVWKKAHLEELLKEDFPVFADFYNINESGHWEHGNYILLRKKSEKEIAKAHNLSPEELQKRIDAAKKKLFKERSKRVKPGLDDKSLTSWNALMMMGCVDAYRVFDEKKFLDAAVANADFITKRQRRQDGGLYHSFRAGRSSVEGFLEDYCFTIEAFIALYQVTFEKQWLHIAGELTEYSIRHFYDESSQLFFFTSDSDEKLIARKSELTDNVIPGSCSSMAKALFLLGKYFDQPRYAEISANMLHNVQRFMADYGALYSNWCRLMLWNTHPFYEISVCGERSMEKRKEFDRHFIPNKLFMCSENKVVEKKTLIQVCQNKTCGMPITETEEAMKQMRYGLI